MPRGELRKFSLGMLFTPADIRLASVIGDNVEKLEKEVVMPALARINRTTQQANDSRYLAYALLSALMVLGVIQPGKRHAKGKGKPG